MKTRSLFKKVVMVAALGTLTGLSYAATNPPAPTITSSTGDLVINATVAAWFQISGLTDITFGAYAGTGVWTAPTESFCVYTNGAAGVYSVTATGSAACGTGFQICRAATDALTYSVSYTDSGGPATPLTHNTNLVGQQGHATLANCGGNNTDVVITIAELDAQAAPAGLYTGTLTFLVAP